MRRQYIRLIFAQDGTGKSVYSDKLSFEPTDTICRVTNVEFDNDAQEWVATLIRTGQVIARGKVRQEVLDAEVVKVGNLLFDGQDINPH